MSEPKVARAEEVPTRFPICAPEQIGQVHTAFRIVKVDFLNS
jgi:hypothetical protein